MEDKKMHKALWAAVSLVTVACGSSGPSPGPTPPTGLNVEVADDSSFAGSFVSSAGMRLAFQAHTDSTNATRATVQSPAATIATVDSSAGQDAPNITVLPLNDWATKDAVDQMIAKLTERYQGRQGMEAAYALYITAGLLRASSPDLDSRTAFRNLAGEAREVLQPPNARAAGVSQNPGGSDDLDCPPGYYYCQVCWVSCDRGWGWDCFWPGQVNVVHCKLDFTRCCELP
jgi:hypothetical protein